jgi:hypothetical protein
LGHVPLFSAWTTKITFDLSLFGRIRWQLDLFNYATLNFVIRDMIAGGTFDGVE